jgi:hypothetical protein
MINAVPKLTRDWQPNFRHFSISSKWLYEEDSRFDATTYAQGAFDILDELEACAFPKAGTHLRRDTVIPQGFQASKAVATSDGHAMHC